MDNIIEKLQRDYQLSESEALVVVGIVSISAFDKDNIQQALNVVDNKLKSIAYNVAMA